MAKKSKISFPSEVFVYITDYDDGVPIFCVATTELEVAEFSVDGKCSVYTKGLELKFRLAAEPVK